MNSIDPTRLSQTRVNLRQMCQFVKDLVQNLDNRRWLMITHASRSKAVPRIGCSWADVTATHARHFYKCTK